MLSCAGTHAEVHHGILWHVAKTENPTRLPHGARRLGWLSSVPLGGKWTGAFSGAVVWLLRPRARFPGRGTRVWADAAAACAPTSTTIGLILRYNEWPITGDHSWCSTMRALEPAGLLAATDCNVASLSVFGSQDPHYSSIIEYSIAPYPLDLSHPRFRQSARTYYAYVIVIVRLSHNSQILRYNGQRIAYHLLWEPIMRDTLHRRRSCSST